jgi:hypothetical protein
MLHKSGLGAPNEARTRDTLRWHRTVAIGVTLVFAMYAAKAAWMNYVDPPGVDFVSFWAAGRMAADGLPADAYNVALHRALELTAGKLGGLQPFPYPPPFLLVVLPFGFAPFWLAFDLWVASTAIIYFLAFRRIAPWPYTFAYPTTLTNALVGQNGLLTSAIFALGYTHLERKPLIGGAVLGLLVIKPQLALLVPIALLAGGYLRSLAAAAASALALIILAYLAFGEETYRAFFAIAHQQAALMTGRIPWPKVASVFGILRFAGVPAVAALAVHGAVAAGAACATWTAWRRKFSTRVEIVAAASLLVSPYLFNHDSLLMMIPIGWLIVHRRRPFIIALLWALSLLAVTAIGPNETPLAAIVAIVVMWSEAVRPETNEAATPIGKTQIESAAC